VAAESAEVAAAVSGEPSQPITVTRSAIVVSLQMSSQVGAARLMRRVQIEGSRGFPFRSAGVGRFRSVEQPYSGRPGAFPVSSSR
jgi:hypothetical protein